MLRRRVLVTLLLCLPAAAPAVELVTITPEWLAGLGAADAGGPPVGKEADWIHGDHVLRNDRIAAVIADPVPTRHANMTVRNVGGCVIDLTLVGRSNDQLSCWYPGDGTVAYSFAGAEADGVAATRPFAVRGRTATLRVAAAAKGQSPRLEVTYTLADGDDFLTVTTRMHNDGNAPITVEPRDLVRADKTFVAGIDAAANCAWWDDEWFGQAYGIVPEGRSVSDNGQSAATRPVRDPFRSFAAGKAGIEIPPGGTAQYVRRVFPAANLPAVRAIATRLSGRPTTPASITVKDAAGPVAGCVVELFVGDRRHGGGRTGPDGRLATLVPAGSGGWRLAASTVGRGRVELPLDSVGERLEAVVELPLPGLVVATIGDERGEPIPCKVQFRRKAAEGETAADPDFGPDSGDTAVKNLVYSHDGRFRQELPPGVYDAIVSLGPEYDAVTLPLAVERGRETPLVATLRRVVDTTGWVSSDFHSHASPSGDNTTSQLGRVQNLLCEHIEFAPCTEHNRISTYVPHLERLGATARMATCSGMELTGSLLPVNHQNAFPLKERPRTQDGGGPVVDNDNPVAQVERLALWDDGAEKLVQMNHPDLVQVLGDRNTDGAADGGFEGMFGFVDVVEVHPPHEIFLTPSPRDDPRKKTSTIFVWMQMLNLGYRVPGVVNTDAHYAFHGSGWLRNYVKSPTDDPARIAVGDVVQACERGRVVMTNGPFLEVKAVGARGGAEATVGPGDGLVDDDGGVSLRVRVQCPNWFDVDRVQVFVNGRADPALNVTRRERPEAFSRDVVRFSQEIPVKLDRDAHLIVATIGEGSSLGTVMGPEHAADKPVAVANPIFVDVGGDGFTANGDLLGLPIPHQEKPTHRRHVHPHAHPHGKHE
jgi:hypothetical protein